MMTEHTPHRMLILLDRDGVINVDRGYSVKSVDQFDFIPGTFEALKKLQDAGVQMAIVTNQASVGRGDLSPEGLEEIHDHMKKSFKEHGIHLETIFCCPDAHDDSYRRKPNPGMVEEALAHFNAHPAHTHMIGDHIRDLQAAHKKACHRHLVLTGHGEKYKSDPGLKEMAPVFIHADLNTAVDYILSYIENPK